MRNLAKKSVLMCGTRYGASYLPAIFQSQEFRLAGFFAKGSAHSIRLSEQCGVPLLTDLSELSQELPQVDLACVAIGQSIAAPLATQLLERGIPVLMEHPISSSTAQALLSAAKLTNTRCHINTHFSQLPPIFDFITLCKQMNKISHPLIVQASCNSRTLFSLLDILFSCFDHAPIHQTQLMFNANNTRPYTQANFHLGDLQCHLTYQNWRGEQDNSQDSPLGHHIVITYPEGSLTLGGTFGPTYWASLIGTSAPANMPIHSSLQHRSPLLADIVQWRISANHQALLDLANTAQTSQDEKTFAAELAERRQSPKQLMHLCSAWTLLNRQLGQYSAAVSAPKNSTQLHSAQSLLR